MWSKLQSIDADISCSWWPIMMAHRYRWDDIKAPWYQDRPIKRSSWRYMENIGWKSVAILCLVWCMHFVQSRHAHVLIWAKIWKPWQGLVKKGHLVCVRYACMVMLHVTAYMLYAIENYAIWPCEMKVCVAEQFKAVMNRYMLKEVHAWECRCDSILKTYISDSVALLLIFRSL